MRQVSVVGGDLWRPVRLLSVVGGGLWRPVRLLSVVGGDLWRPVRLLSVVGRDLWRPVRLLSVVGGDPCLVKSRRGFSKGGTSLVVKIPTWEKASLLEASDTLTGF